MTTQALTNFTFEDCSIRVFGDFIKPLFVAADVCKALSIQNVTQALQSLAPFERSMLNIGRQGNANVVTESGLYTLILRCRDAVKEGTFAYRFRVWVTNEVLPAIRKQGFYAVQKEQNSSLITNAQQVAIQQAVARRAKKTAVYYQTIYRAIKVRYQIPRYTELKQSQFEDCLRFIETVDLSVPEAPASEPTKTERQRYVVYADFLKTLQVFCYYQRYLFRKPLMQAMRVMLALDVPDASKLWDVVNNLNFVELERSLDDLGFSVKDLDCYKHWALTHAA
ncbi:BRO family protein [Parasutterella excrementihominis YIT 11859]|uniref:BRO family protein n=1 Tax=Parasutterella excrementihominis YIT 11859 TaxID=762966 RepID=F3QJC4_9BURK|nr:BRO family protein [Parasutterella excrementihominis]EGG55772.1 BRO family protein [Parasutterella excrementihominis YIT 11859]